MRRSRPRSVQNPADLTWDEVRRALDKIDPHRGTPREWQAPADAYDLRWTRERVKVGDVLEVEPYSKRDVAKYARRSPATQPPVLLVQEERGYVPWDGAHRVAAARLRGDRDVDAFVGRSAGVGRNPKIVSLGPGATEAAAGLAVNPQLVTMAVAQEAWRKIGRPSVDLEELRVGMEVEQEHTGDLDEAAKIALDHLNERGLPPNSLTPNRPPLDDIVSALRQAPEFTAEIGLAPVSVGELEQRLIGAGHYAYAFALDLGLVLKVTDDEDDAGAAELLRKFHPTVGLPHVLDVKRLPGDWLRSETDAAAPHYLYAIVMEAVLPATRILTRAEQLDLRWAFKDALGIDAGTRRARFEGEDFEITPRMQQIMGPVLKGLRWLEQRGYRVTDVHANNIGIAAGNRPVVFDLGHGSRSDDVEDVEIDLAMNGRLPRARKHFDECFDVIEARFDDFGDCELHRDERAGSDNGAGSDRQYGYCKDGDPIVIAFAEKIEQLPEANIRGLMRHEFGHALDYRYGDALGKKLGRRLPSGVERRADAIAEAVFGEPIEYDERLVQCVACGGTSPRPRKLPR